MTLTVTHRSRHPRCEWVRIDRSTRTGVAVVAVGGVAHERAEELWDLVEYALETADGDTVTVDLTAVTGFDHHTMDTLRTVVRTARRRRDDMRILLYPESGLDYYTRQYGLDSRIISTAKIPSPRRRATGGQGARAMKVSASGRTVLGDRPLRDADGIVRL